MEQQQEGNTNARTSITPAEAATLEIIRTETVLSRLPVHNLAKKGSISIQILKKTETGEIELLWRVSPSRDYGEPRQLAYKLDTIIINQKIDEAGRPLPKLLRLGSLNDICAELGLTIDHGTNAKNIRNAFLQNALTGITAKFNYRANDGSERRLEAGFTRYSVIFTGEKLPDGRKADAVYVIFNEPFWEVLNNAPVRPLDRTYMKELPPAAQRFYEIISRKIFAALKNNYARAKILYSEYCTFSAQLRHFERQRVQDQMAKVLRPHKASGYITAIQYEPTIDAESKPDWIMYLTPGPKARVEFDAAHNRRRKTKTVEALAEGVGDHPPKRSHTTPRQQPAHAQAIVPNADPRLVAEFTRRGITEEKAIQLIADRKPGQDVVAQLEITDQMIEHAGFKIVNPPGFYIRQIEHNITVPDNFETSAKRKEREERERKERAERERNEARQQLEWDYDDYCDGETDRYIAEHPAEFEALREAKLIEERGKQSFGAETTAKIMARQEIHKRLTFLTFEEFLDRRRQGTDFSLKLVGPSLAPEPVADLAEPTDPLPAAEQRDAETSEAAGVVDKSQGESLEPLALPEDAGIDEPPTAPATDELPKGEIRDGAMPSQLTTEMTKPVVELVSDSPQEENLDGMAAGEQAA